MQKELIELVEKLKRLGYKPGNGFGKVLIVFEHDNIVDVEITEKRKPKFDKIDIKEISIQG